MSKEFIIRQINEDEDLKYYSEKGWVVKQVIIHEVVHDNARGIKWDRYHILFERDNEDGDTKKFKALEIIKRNPKHILNALQKFPTYSTYKDYCDNCRIVEIAQYIKTQDEFDLLKEVMK